MTERKTILVSACGSSIGLEVLRSLHMSRRTERIIGMEVSWWGAEIARKYCDEVVIVSRGSNPDYAREILSIIENQSVDIVFLNTEPEIEAIIDIRDNMEIPVSCAFSDGLLPCIDKKVLHERLEGTEITAKTTIVESIDDIAHALNEWGPKIWLRCSKGPRGKGSIPIEDIEIADIWMTKIADELEPGSEWMVHEFLPGRNLNWTSLWKDGNLLMSSAGERLAYFLSDVSISGITGNVSNCRTVEGDGIRQVAMGAVLNADSKPNGIYSVDLKENSDGRPIVTEINARQAFRPLLYAHAGANFSAAFIDSFLYEKDVGKTSSSQSPDYWEMVRGMDFEPIFRKMQ